MNTKFIMAASALFLGVIGFSLTFLPREIADLSGISTAAEFVLMLQLTGAVYFAFAMLNWMIKGAIIGGIYNKPIAMANFTHFFIGALALAKAASRNPTFPQVVWILACFYIVFAILFGMISFRHPVEKK